MNTDSKTPPHPLHGIRVAEFTHMVMGPTCGLILADLGADVIKIEPPGGDKTRRLLGSGAGYFPMYNRNKRSVCLDLKSKAGKTAALKIIDGADVLIENFRPGAMEKLGFGYEEMAKRNPRLIYCSEKGFLDGPYAHRTALDEVAQMMGGLAYMTGPPGRPLRAGASVIDVQGGLFGALGVLAALQQRQHTGRGQQVVSSLFENSVFLVGQHMAQFAVTGEAAAPMPARISAWAVYEIFDTADQQQVFVGVVSDTQWRQFCQSFELSDFAQDASLATNAERVRQRDRIIPVIKATFGRYHQQDLMDKLERTGLPFAPIARPESMFDDPHLQASDGLLELTLTDGQNAGSKASLPALPLAMDGRRFRCHKDLPRIGQHTIDVLIEAGYNASEVDKMLEQGAAFSNN